MSAALEAVTAETQTGDTDDGSVVIDLVVTDKGKTRTGPIRVPDPNSWKARSNRALREGDFESWAEQVLPEEDFDTWCDLDPTNGEVEAFFTAWKDATGQDVGKSRASRRSSRSTARR